MKNFNLEQIDKKTPYQIPENFFEEMQGNVLDKIAKKPKKETKIFKLNFTMVTSLAAALAIIFGFTFLWKTNQTEITKPVEIAQNTISQTTKTSDTKSIETPLEKLDVSTISDIHKTAQSIENQTTEKVNLNANSTEKSIATSDENYEQLLNSLSDDELKELSKNTDQDIYLELYN